VAQNLGIPDGISTAAEKGLHFYEQTWRKPAITIIAGGEFDQRCVEPVLRGDGDRQLPHVPDQDPEQ